MPSIEIAKIKVRDRLREDNGDLAGLVASVKKYGLIHPIVLTDDGVLIAGARRLAACKALGMRVIEARRFGDLSPIERREIELDENLHRKDLTEHERAKFTIELKAAGEAALKDERGKNGSILPTVGKKDPRGRKPKGAVALQDVAERIGIPRQTIERAEAHVAIAAKYPLLQGGAWSQRAAVATGQALDALPTLERKHILALVEEHAAPAPSAEKMIGSWARATPQVRERIYEIARGKDPQARSAVISLLAKCAPEPDARSLALEEAARGIRRAVARYPGDPMNAKCEALAAGLNAFAKDLDAAHTTRTKHLEESLK